MNSLAALLAVAQLATSEVPVEDSLETPLHLVAPFAVRSASGLTYHVPPAYVISERAWRELDSEMRRLQTAEIRLEAENKYLRQAPVETPVLSWVALAALSLGTGVAVGLWLQ